MKFDMTRFDEIMTPFWEGDTVYEETVFFLFRLLH